MQLFEGEIWREVLFGDRRQGAFGFGKNGVGRAKPDAVQQSVDRQQPFRFLQRVLERIERTLRAFVDEFAVERLAFSEFRTKSVVLGACFLR